MSWAMHHKESERLAIQAEAEMRNGNRNAAIAFYRQAAEAEVKAIGDLDVAKLRTLSITVVSAVSLLFKAAEFSQAQVLAYYWLGQGILLPFALEQLRDLLQRIWSEEALRKVSINFTRGEVLVSVSGGEVVYGGAPLDLIHRKMDEVKHLFYRTIEFMMGMPHRTKGSPILEIQQQCRPWLFQAPAGSYQFSVRVQKPEQLQLPEIGDVTPQVDEITERFLQIVGAAANDPDGALAEIVTDEDYKQTFVKLARNLAPAPNGKAFRQIDIRPAYSLESAPISFVPESRATLNKALRTLGRTEQEETQRLVGVLRALHLDKDWIEISTGDGTTQRIRGVEGTVDDVIGPMVNHLVAVNVVKVSGRYRFRDIEIEE